MKRKIAFSIFTMLLLISFLTISSHAALSGFATSIGTRYNGIDTNWSAEFASKCYDIYGYSPSNFLMDPNYILRLSNMGAKVQCYNEHGNVDNIRGSNSGIVVGQGDDTLYVGTDKFDTWSSAGTVLVSYICCKTAGSGGLNENSITYRTAVRGAQIALGFTDSMATGPADLWSNNYNIRLSQGYGALAAAEYANSFSYDDERVKSWHVVHHGNPNLNLAGGTGKTDTLTAQDEIMTNNLEETSYVDRNILNTVNSKVSKIASNYSDIISNVNEDFDINNYEITKTKSGSTNVLTGETVEKEYIDLKLKVGDFITNAGYVVEIENNNVIAIYDNNINLEKQNDAINNSTAFDTNNSRVAVNEEAYVKEAMKQVSDNFSDFNVNITKTATHYYYDIKEDVKYFVVTVSTELNKDNIVSLSEDSIYFEMN